MRNDIVKKHELQTKRKWRVRKRMHGTDSKPRLTVMKSNKHIHAQLIDDDKGHTIGSVTTASKEHRKSHGKKNKEAARKLGEEIGAIAMKQNIKEIVFDRGPYKYHGVLAELADGVRQAGLKF